MSAVTTKLKSLPATPGVYMFKDSRGYVLYVGKAKLLRSRVRSYFATSAVLELAKQQMVQHVADIETISTDTETEALVLEANLIRKHQPPYNVVLRDDKYYLFIKITTQEEYPRVFLTRQIRRDKARYFGPYSSAHSVRATLRLLRRVFPHRSEKDSPHDIIFPHPLFTQKTNNTSKSFIEKGPSADQYNLNIQNIIKFLQGKREEILATLEEGMKEAAAASQFERAAIFRDQWQAIDRLEGTQKVYLPRQETFDMVSIARDTTQSAANVFQIRQGKLLNKHTFLLRHRTSASPGDTLRQFLLQYYGVAQDVPHIICIPFELSDSVSITEWIRKEHPPQLLVPQRGKKRQLLLMGETNAQQLLSEQEAAFQSAHRLQEAHTKLVAALGLSKADIHRVETYDVSNIQGNLATASMVVFVDGQPQRQQYRKFRIRYGDALRLAQGKPNDFAMLQETLQRRFSGRHEEWPIPDLIVIDGGKGQLSAAQKMLDQLGVAVPVISLAKREEEIFLPGRKDSLRLPYNSDALHLMQRMRDEAHRFTITYHRLLRSKRQQRSILDEVPGIGPKTKKKLLAHFGSLRAIRAASTEELTPLIGPAKAHLLKEYI